MSEHSIPGRRVVVVAAFRFPHGDAMSNRLLQLTRSAALGGPSPVVINDWPPGAGWPDAVEVPSGLNLVTLSANARSRAGRLVARATRPFRVVRAMRSLGIRRASKPVVVVPQGLLTVSSVLVYKLWMLCRLVVDVTEHHDRAQFRSPLNTYYLRHRWTALLGRLAADRVVTVSSKLAASFAGKVPARAVPPQVDVAEYAPCAPPPIRHGVRLIYAGTPGTKDQLNVIIDGIRLLPEDAQRRLSLSILGISAADAQEASDLRATSYEDLSAQVELLGRVPRSKVHALLAESHFSVLIRPSADYAEAGFPSKVPESLAAGCPVILTPTGDLPRYIQEGQEGLLVEGCSAEAVSEAFQRALSLDDAGWARMSQAASARARNDFDYRADPEVGRFVRD